MGRTPERTQFLTDVLITAAEGGIRDWAHIVTYKWDCPEDDRRISFYEIEEDDEAKGYITAPVRTVNLDRIEEALARIADEKVTDDELGLGGKFRLTIIDIDKTLNGEAAELAGEDLDAYHASAIVQIAAHLTNAPTPGTAIYG